MPDIRHASNTAVLLAALPLADPTTTEEHVKSWLVDRPLAPKPYPQGWERGGVAPESAKVATIASLTAVELEVLRVVGALQDRHPSIRPARAIELVVTALSKATAELCIEALRTIGDLEYLEGRV